MEKCVKCGEIVDESYELCDDPSEHLWSSNEDTILCQNCYENLFEYPNSLNIYDNENMFEVAFENNIAAWIDGEPAELSDFILNCVKSIVKSERYVHTDAWRGYVDVPGGDDVVEIANFGIYAYHHSEIMRKMCDEAIREAMTKLGIPLFRVIARTSNIFSSNASYFVAKEHEAIARKVSKFIVNYYEGKHGWNDGLIFSELQDNTRTRKLVEELKQKKSLIGTDWSALFPAEKNQ